MVLTRSMSSTLDDEERQRFLREGADAARGRAVAGISRQTAGVRAGAGAGDAQQGRVSPRMPPPDASTARPGRSASAEPQGAALPAALISQKGMEFSPKSPSVDLEALWRTGMEGRRGRKKPVTIPPDSAGTKHMDWTTEKADKQQVKFKESVEEERRAKRDAARQNAREGQNESQQADVSEREARRETQSNTSVVSSTIAKLQEAELEADEQLAQLEMKRLQIEAELIKKRLAATITRIQVEGSQQGSARGGESVLSVQSQRKVEQWLHQSKDATTEPVQPKKRRHLDDQETTQLGETPRRPAIEPDPEQRRTRVRSLNREGRQRSLSPTNEPYTPRTGRTQESTVTEGMMNLFEKMQMAARPAPKDIYELPHFYGDVSEWRSFYNTYSETTKRYNFTEYENVARLRMALRGDAKACVQHVLSTATRPEMIIRILKKQFGRSEVLLDRAIEDLRRLPQLGSSAHDLNAFAIKIMNIVSTIMDLDRRHYADNPMLIREVTDRLSPHLRSRWCDYARTRQDTGEPEIVQLADFLMDESEQEMAFCHARAVPRRILAASTAAPPVARGLGNIRMSSAPPRPPANTTAPGRYTTAPRAAYTTQANYIKNICLFCGGNHTTSECRKLAAQNLGARWDWAKLNRVCFKCLEGKHRRDQCKAKGCGVVGCPHSHHRLLHQDEPAGPPPVPAMNFVVARTAAPQRATTAAPLAARSQPQPPPPELQEHRDAGGARAYTSVSSHEVLLKVLPVTISGPSGTAHIFAMLDDGSTLSLLEEDIAGQIGAVGPDTPLCVRGIGNSVINSMTQEINATVRPARGGDAFNMTLRTVSGLGLRSQTLNRERLLSYPHLSDLSNEIYTTGVPQMLIGLDHWHLMIANEVRTGGRNEPCAVRTPLGWAFFGIMPKTILANHTSMHCYSAEEAELNELVKKHWSIEALGVSTKENVSPRDQRALDMFNATIRKVGDKYEVGQLWADDEVKLPPSFAMAQSRLRNLESKMSRDEAFAAEYRRQINNLIEKGYAERIIEPPKSDRTWFLPHFSVFNAYKGKYRAVFDCAAKSQGYCLNDFVLPGPDLLQNLIGILLRFREWGFAVVADIQEMFLRIQITQQDQASQLFLWRSSAQDRAPHVYKLKRVCFGNVSSPFIAHSVRNRNAEDCADRYPKALEEIKKNHYMDDYVASYETEHELFEATRQVSEAHAEGGFHLRGYASNSEQLLATIEPNLRAQEPTLLGEKEQSVLGMSWEPITDTLGYNTKLLRVPKEVVQQLRPPSKRELLSTIMSIYDPLGLISQYVISAKIIFQRVWTAGTSWDEPIAEKERDDFALWLCALQSVATLRIPRQYSVPGPSPIYELHVFTDASTEAYCAVAYWRIVGPDGVAVSLAAGKSRVCPLKVMTVPRLELTAAVIGVRLAQTIVREQRYSVSNITFWTDSQILVGWVRDDARQYKAFVSHRIAEIAEKSDRRAWRYLPTNLNPADHGTRCKPAQQIHITDVWYQGPHFLRLPESEWPPIYEPRANLSLPERRQEETAATTTTREARNPEAVLPDIARFSNYNRLMNATGYVLLFIEKLKTKNRTLELDVRHLRQAEHMWLQCSQRRSFPREIQALSTNDEIHKKSKLYSLAPELCDDGVLRMKTRTTKAPVLYATTRPIILDGRDAFTRLLIVRTHRRSAHIHNEAIVNELRTKYWILHLRSSVKKIAYDCALCRLRRANPRAQPFGDLPIERMQAFQRPFAHTAQDYMGPMYVTIGRRREKRWVCLYTCLTTRAIHLEPVHSLSTDSAILALRRFAARRGWPVTMYSDNATCFRASAIELREAFKAWLPELRAYGVQHRMQWKFIPPGNPSAGGAWERMIRTVKTALTYTLHTRAPRDELFNTLLAEVENIVNRRPLTHVSTDPNAEESLTPAHFLLLNAANLPILGGCDEDDRKQWRASQALADHFWRRWVAEYYPLLAPRQSSTDGGRQIQPGDVVVIAEPNGPRSVWPRGVVERIYPGPDGRVRSADVRTRHGVFRRPTCRLAVIVSQPMQQRSSGEDAGTNVGDTTPRT